MNPCTDNNEEFRGADVGYNELSDADKMTAWRRTRDLGNKDEDLRSEMVEYMTLGGTHPMIMKGLGE